MSLITIEQNTRFSNSLLWKYQRDYFAARGVDAWAKGDVPFYVTSNVVIANNYAQIAIRFIIDNINNKSINPEKPIYMFELGTGSGKFSYLFLSKLTTLFKEFNLDHLKFCYVMTDFTNNNLAFWQGHQSLKPFLEKGMLDFAIYQIGETQDINLINKKISLGTNSCENPIIVVGNYIFDTVPHDVFRVYSGNLEQGLITTKTPEDNKTDTGIISLDRLLTEFNFSPATLPYYNNEAMDNILKQYTTEISTGTFLVPMGAIHCMDNLRRLSNNRLLLITCDKGYASTVSLNNLGTPHIAFHGSFSMMVNFDFLARYLINIGGDSLINEDYEGTKVVVLGIGQKFNNLPETKCAYDQFNTHLATNDFLLIKNFIIRDISALNLEQLLALLKFSYWDCDIFFSIASQLAKIVTQGSPGYLNTLRAGLKKLEANYYFIKNYKNIPFELAHIYQVLGDYPEAIKHYQNSINWFGEESAAFFNCGLCYFYKNSLPEALDNFKKAVAINPDNTSAKEWIAHVEKQL